VPGALNGAALGPDGRIYLCNNGGFAWLREQGTLRPIQQADDYTGGGIDVYDPATGQVQRLYSACNGIGLKGPNDLVFDTSGGFWFTDLGKRRARDLDRGFVYYARPDGSELREVIGPLLTPNGIGLSPDGKTLYVAETETARLWAWDILSPGVVRKRPWPSPAGGTLVSGMAGYHRFDSLAVASSGNICIAALHACAIVEMSPDGARVQLHPVPDLGVTNLCFGGPDMRTAYVTLSHEGRLAAMDWHEPGLRLNF
jgi:gluconolactonase